MRKFLAVGLAAALLLTLSGTAFAAKGGNKGGTSGPTSTSASLSVPNGVFGQTDTAVTSPGLWVDATCSQNGAVVYEEWVAADASGNAVLTLGPTPSWTGGAAGCSATANMLMSTGSMKTVASTTFSVAGS